MVKLAIGGAKKQVHDGRRFITEKTAPFKLCSVLEFQAIWGLGGWGGWGGGHPGMSHGCRRLVIGMIGFPMLKPMRFVTNVSFFAEVCRSKWTRNHLREISEGLNTYIFQECTGLFAHMFYQALAATTAAEDPYRFLEKDTGKKSSLRAAIEYCEGLPSMYMKPISVFCIGIHRDIGLWMPIIDAAEQDMRGHSSSSWIIRFDHPTHKESELLVPSRAVRGQASRMPQQDVPPCA